MRLAVRFADYRLDGDQRRLTRDGVDVHLGPKAFDLLCVLVAEAPRVVSKVELHERLWPRTHVSEATLTGLIKELRRAIDEPEVPSLIRTAHGVGYAFASALSREARPSFMTRHWLILAERAFALTSGENLIGRDPLAALCLHSAGVSRRHARVLLHDGGATLEDLGSKNGTRVGDETVTAAVSLADGDVIRVGRAEIVYRVSSDPLSTQTQ